MTNSKKKILKDVGYEEKEIKPELLLDCLGRSVSELTEDIANIFKGKNILFYRPNAKQIIEIGKIKLQSTDKEVYTGFRQMKDKRFVTLLEKYSDVGQMVKGENGKFFSKRSMSPNKADIILSSHIIEEALPQIERIFLIPLPILFEGELTFPKKGYDSRFSSWRPYDSPEVENPNMDVNKAKEIIDGIFSEFCFKSDQDKTNAIAAFITPFLRGLYKEFSERTAVFFYIGNRERVGKDYCAGVTGMFYEDNALDDTPISSGENNGNNNEELRKKITSALMGRRKRMHFANNKAFINNAIIEQTTTSKISSDR